jgi:membrane fusion protein, multidrug efflux system
MAVSETEGDAPKRNRVLPPDSGSNHGSDGQDHVVKIESDSRPEPQPQPQPQPQTSKQHEYKALGKDDNKASKPLPKWPLALGALAVAALVGAVLWLIYEPRPDVRTDDAYITVHYASIAPRISGQISSVLVDDNDTVKAGQILVTLDPRDYETAIASAEATLARDTAQLEDVSATLARQPAIIGEQEGNVAAAQARLSFTEPDARRYQFLAATDAGTIQQRERADSALRESRAQLDGARAALEASRRQTNVIKAQQQAAEAVVAVDKALLEQAPLNLSYTKIPAPVDGMIAVRSVEVGNTVSPGTTLMTVVPLAQVYIISNYREVDLRHVRPGQSVTIHLDAYNIDLDGTVNGIGAASGVSFSPIQPNNATGNFTKIVQRLPVKIDVNPNQPLAKLLRVGLSVETTIHTGLENIVDEQRHSTSRVTEH